MVNDSKTDYPVCPVGKLGHAECLEFTLPEDLTIDSANHRLITTDAFMLNWQGEFHAYLNSCPHTHVNLNWTPNQFLDVESQYIQCSLHGAIFEPLSGICVRGPCLGQSLISLPTVIHDGMVNIDLKAVKSG